MVVAPSPDGALDAAEQEVVLSARGVHGTPLDIVGVAPGPGDALDHALVHLVLLELELILTVQRRGADEGVDAAARRRPDGLGRPVDVACMGPGEPADDALLDPLGDRRDRLEVTVRGDREPGLDDIDPHALEHGGDPDLLLDIHRAAGRLLPVAQGRIEDDDVVVGRFRLVGHGHDGSS